MSEVHSKTNLEDLSPEEMAAVLQHKWFLSEKAGCDVGIEIAAEDFFNRHSVSWRKKRLEDDLEDQKREILKHKWFLSEKTGKDIGLSAAALDWIRCGFAEHWRNRTGPYKDRK